MYLDSISIVGFKNLAQNELRFAPSLNCFVGFNGSGKTNLLDAIHFLSLTKSAVTSIDGACVNHDGEFFIIKGNFVLDADKHEQVTVSYKRNSGKKVMRSGKEYERLGEHIGMFPAVMVCPQDVALVADASDERRRFLNSFLSQINAEYLSLVVRYNALLLSRNKLLKSPDGQGEIIDIISSQIGTIGDRICGIRAEFIEQFRPIVKQYYKAISGDNEPVEISYRSQLCEGSMESLLRASLGKDIALGHTTVGIHRDDLVLTMNGHPIRVCGSQGQQKSLLIALKLAEAKVIGERVGKKAIMLLDDVFDKLDMDRVANLIEVVSSDHFGQIFITDSNKVRLEQIVEKFAEGYEIFNVCQGDIQ